MLKKLLMKSLILVRFQGTVSWNHLRAKYLLKQARKKDTKITLLVILNSLKYTLQSKSKKCCLRSFMRFAGSTNINMLKVRIGTLEKGVNCVLKLTIKTPERRHWLRSGVFIITFEHIGHLFVCYYSWLWTDNCLFNFVQMFPFNSIRPVFCSICSDRGCNAADIVLFSTNKMADILYVSDNEQPVLK